MSVNSRQIWDSSIQEELDFWRKWLLDDEFKAAREARLGHLGLGVPDFTYASLNTDVLKILDVGSGPISTLGTSHPQFRVQLTLVDPLGNAYNQLLQELGFSSHIPIVNACGEDLISYFSPDSFHVVHSANALDHAYDPLLCIQNMLSLCQPGGWVYVVSVENEAERQSYSGLHQWNFSLDSGSVRLWNKSASMMLHEYLSGFSEIRANPVDHGNGLPMFELFVQKSPR